MDRPVTSKPRGVCRYYNTARGCYAGDDCKFLHGADEKLTPYDKAKVCRYYVKGHCTRGEKCWFRHALPSLPPDDERTAFDAETCSICLEKPITYGLLMDCSHVFCLQCIRQWRDPGGKSSDSITSGAIKCCPLCRTISRFVTPSTHFFPQGNPQKKLVIDAYKASTARVPCRYFQATSGTETPCCPFGTDCFYQHLNPDGTPYIFRHGAKQSMIIYRRHQRNAAFPWSRPDYMDPIQFLQHIFENPLTNLHATLDVIRASLPALIERYGTNGASTREDDEESEGFSEHENEEPILLAESLAVERSMLDESGRFDSSLHTPLVTGDQDREHAASVSRSSPMRPRSASLVTDSSEGGILPPARPLSSAETRNGLDETFRPVAPASTFGSLGSSEPPLSNSMSRFSTVVPSRSREALVIDISDEEDEDTEESFAVHPSSTDPAYVKSPQLPASSLPVTRPPTPTDAPSSSPHTAETMLRQQQFWSSTRNTAGRSSGSRRSRTGRAPHPTRLF